MTPEDQTAVTSGAPTLTMGRSWRVAPVEPTARFESEFLAGELVSGCYLILSILGSGGMGWVYLAEDRDLHRTVALKTSRPMVSHETLRAEAQVLAAFHHPGLPAVYSVGVHRDIEYLVMERIPGITLAEHQARQAPNPLPLEESLDILIGLAETLSVLHDAGLAHRDVKPENVMVAGKGRVVLLDCGIALHERFMGAEQLVRGSLMHMAPETIAGCVQAGEGHLVDIYAMGVIAFELLTMRSPFRQPRQVEHVRQQSLEPALRLSSQRPEVPIELDLLVAAMLEPSPGGRPPTVQSVITALSRARRSLVAQAERIESRPPARYRRTSARCSVI